MSHPGNTRRVPVPHFEDASQRLLNHHRDQARIAALERALADCLREIDILRGVPTDKPEPDRVLNAKKLIGWPL